MLYSVIFLILLCFYFDISTPTHYTKVYYEVNKNKNATKCTILTQEILSKEVFRGLQYNLEKEITQGLHLNHLDGCEKEEDKSSHSKIIELFSSTVEQIQREIEESCSYVQTVTPISGKAMSVTSSPDIVKIMDGGKSLNRIDVVLMGDGYKEEERDKFFSDIIHLVNETLKSPTFEEFLPLMNIWAIFTASKESGISYPRRARNTKFKLYRNSDALRSIYVRNKKTARTVCGQLGTSACDFPIIIGNDDYYGGIGGEFAVSTSSKTSGAMVLRHELGHNFAKVGEEYDRGEVYVGVNTAQSLQTVGWKVWLTSNETRPREERMIYRILSFPQTDLDKRAVTYSFNSNGRYSGWFLTLTLSGSFDTNSVQILLDGFPLPWKTSGNDDKSIYSWTNIRPGLTRGRHNLTIAATSKANPKSKRLYLLPNATWVPRTLGSVSFYEFGNSNEFQNSNDVISAYPTWNLQGRKSYRPSNNGCLMRNMSHDHLCNVCKEGVWLQFLRRVSLIDDLIIQDTNSNNATKQVTVQVILLGQFRRNRLIHGERLEITWMRNGKEQTKWKDHLRIDAEKGFWQVGVKLFTPRIRNDQKQLTLDTKSFTID